MKQENTKTGLNIDFVGKVGLFGGISLALVILSAVYILVRGIPYGIDFSGGTEVQVKFQSPVAMEDLRKISESPNILNVALQNFGDGNEFIIRFQTKTGANDKETNETQQKVTSDLKSRIEKDFKDKSPEIRRVDTVGPQVGDQLKRNGLLSVFYSLLVILVYVALRFDYKYAPGAVICLFHDAVITLAIFILVGKEVNIPIMAAILTLIGYSLNDTIVVFDRIRETEGHASRKDSMASIINKAINEMFVRTLITSGTTFTSALCLFLIADGTVADIAFAIAVGIFFGTYSSIYVAAPLILVTDKLMNKKSTSAVPAT